MGPARLSFVLILRRLQPYFLSRRHSSPSWCDCFFFFLSPRKLQTIHTKREQQATAENEEKGKKRHTHSTKKKKKLRMARRRSARDICLSSLRPLFLLSFSCWAVIPRCSFTKKSCRFRRHLGLLLFNIRSLYDGLERRFFAQWQEKPYCRSYWLSYRISKA